MKRAMLGLVEQAWVGCQRCGLGRFRSKMVFWRGSPEAKVAIVGEGPGREEDRLGKPFVGPAGRMLDDVLTRAGFDPGEVFIMNVVACRPPSNRTPQVGEVWSCKRRVAQMLWIVRPRVVVLAGTAAAGLAGISAVTPFRGTLTTVELAFNGVPLRLPAIPTFHPSFLLRNPGEALTVVDDFQAARRIAQ